MRARTFTRDRAVGGGRRLRWATLALAAVAVGVCLTAPQPADASVLGPVGDVVGAGVNVITGGLGGAAAAGFGGILKALFAWPAKLIDRQLLAWLVAVPEYAYSPDGGQANRLAALAATTSAMAFGGLGAIATVSGVRYWAAGLSGSGGFDALEALPRLVGAALLIVLWPWLFRHAAALANDAAEGLLGSGSVLDDTSQLLARAFAGAVTMNFFSILIACGAGVLFLALLMSKIVVSADTALLFVAMPLPVALWVLPELAWGARAAMRAFVAILAVPLVWALCFATFAAVGTDALGLDRVGSLADSLIRPLVALALLWLTVVLPRSLIRMALFGAAGGGLATRAASYVVLRRADAVVSQAIGGRADRLPTAAPKPTAGQASDGGSGAGTAAGAVAAIAATAAGAPSGAAGTVAAVTHTPGGEPGPTADAPGQASAPVPAPSAGGEDADGGSRGLVMPPWRSIAQRVPLELAAAQANEASTAAADVGRALGSLPAPVRRGVAEEMQHKEGRIRGEMAQQAARADLRDGERDAFRVLAAASPEVRVAGLRAFEGVGTDTGSQIAGDRASDVMSRAAGDPAPTLGDGPMGQPSPTAHDAPASRPAEPTEPLGPRVEPDERS